MRKNKGFTLIELLVVIVIIGILAVLIFLALQRAQKSARDAQRKSFARDVATAEAMYYDANKHYGSYSELTPATNPYLTNTASINPRTSGDADGTWNIYQNTNGTLDCSATAIPTPSTNANNKFCVSSRLEADVNKGFRCTQEGCSDTK